MYIEHEQNTDVQSLDTASQQNFFNVHRTLNKTQMFSLLILHHNKTTSMYTEHEQNTDVQSLDNNNLFASMLSHLVTFDLSRFVQVEYSQFSC